MNAIITFPTTEAAISALCERVFGAPCAVSPPKLEPQSEFEKTMEEAKEQAIRDMDEDITRFKLINGRLQATIETQKNELATLRATHSRLVDMLGSEDIVTAVQELTDHPGIPDLVITDKDMDPTESGKYRIIEAGETLTDGDEVFMGSPGWQPFDISINDGKAHVVQPFNTGYLPQGYYRRPIQEAPPEQKYRVLDPGEIIQKGDEVRDILTRKWSPARGIGNPVSPFCPDTFRRPIQS